MAVSCLEILKRTDREGYEALKDSVGYYVEGGTNRQDFARILKSQFGSEVAQDADTLFDDIASTIKKGEPRKRRLTDKQKAEAKAIERAKERALKAAIERLGGEDGARELIERFKKIDPEDPRAQAQFIHEFGAAKSSDKIYEVWINSLLSNPTTHIVNIVGNTTTAALRPIIERPLAAGVDAVRSLIGRTPRKIFMREIAADLQGMAAGFTEGVQAAIKAFNSEIPIFGGVSKLEHQIPAAIKGRAGRLIRLPGRMLMASDEFFKAINYRGGYHAEAMRIAMRENPKNFRKKYAELLDVPTESMIQKAESEAYIRTFQNDLGSIGKTVNQLRTPMKGDDEAIKLGKNAIRVFVPFLRTPLNIVKFGGERTPIGFIKTGFNARKMIALKRKVGKIQKEFTSGDITEKEYKRRIAEAKVDGISVEEFEEQLIRPLMGTAIVAATAGFVQSGQISGRGPTNKAERDALRATGWQPYSVKAGDKWFSYSRLDPVAIPVGMAADYVEMQDVLEADAFTSISRALAQNMTSKTYMTGVSDLLDVAMSSEPHKVQRAMQRLSSSVIPSGVGAVSRAIDDEIRTSRTSQGFAERAKRGIQAKVPLWRQGLPTIRNIWGEKVMSDESGVWKLMSPFRMSEVKNHPATKEIVRLKYRISMTHGKKINKIKLTESQHSEYLARAGKLSKIAVSELISDPDYKETDDEEKISEIRRAISRARREAKNDMIDKYGFGE